MALVLGTEWMKRLPLRLTGHSSLHSAVKLNISLANFGGFVSVALIFFRHQLGVQRQQRGKNSFSPYLRYLTALAKEYSDVPLNLSSITLESPRLIYLMFVRVI